MPKSDFASGISDMGRAGRPARVVHRQVCLFRREVQGKSQEEFGGVAGEAARDDRNGKRSTRNAQCATEETEGNVEHRPDLRRVGGTSNVERSPLEAGGVPRMAESAREAAGDAQGALHPRAQRLPQLASRVRHRREGKAEGGRLREEG